MNEMELERELESARLWRNECWQWSSENFCFSGFAVVERENDKDRERDDDIQ